MYCDKRTLLYDLLIQKQRKFRMKSSKNFTRINMQNYNYKITYKNSDQKQALKKKQKYVNNNTCTNVLLYSEKTKRR